MNVSVGPVGRAMHVSQAQASSAREHLSVAPVAPVAPVGRAELVSMVRAF